MQQINLYRPEFRPSHEPLRAVHMLWGVVALILLLGVYSGFTNQGNARLQQELADEQALLASQQLTLQKISLQQTRNQPAQLDAEIDALRQDIGRRQQILALITDQDFGNTAGFSAHIQAMARQSLETLALERFSLKSGGNYVELAGKTREPDQVPLYLQRLRAEDSFSKVRFGVLNVERNEEDAYVLQFQVTKPAPKEKK